MKKILLSMALVLVTLIPLTVNAESKEKINVYIFTKSGCSYCAAAKSFFAELESTHGNYFTLVELDINTNNNSTLGEKVAKQLGDTFSGVPYIVIGTKSYVGYTSSYNDSITSTIEDAYKSDSYNDLVASLQGDVKVEDDSSMSKGTIITIVAVAVIGIIGFIYIAGKQN